MSTALAGENSADVIELGSVTPFSDYLKRGGRKDERGLILFTVGDQMVIPDSLLQKGSAGLLWPLVRDINTLYLNGTAEQKYHWWITTSVHLGGRAPIDFVDSLDQRIILIGMARNHRPSTTCSTPPSDPPKPPPGEEQPSPNPPGK
jgi:hypothetical protein